VAEDNTVHVTSQKKHLGTACAAFTSGLSTWWSSRPGAVPTAAGVEVIEGAGKLRSADHAFAGCGVGIDHVAFLSLKRLGLSREGLAAACEKEPKRVLLTCAGSEIQRQLFAALSFIAGERIIRALRPGKSAARPGGPVAQKEKKLTGA
jgi:hypothetical protein